jgi:ferredoxin-NADP reductase
MPNPIDNLLNRITMYRVALYYLLILWAVALALSALGKLPFTPLALVVSTIVLLAVSITVNELCARFLKIPANVESVYITALILSLIITPSFKTSSLWFYVWAAVLAMATKYLITWRRKHLFNPAALAVVLTAFIFNQYASWWVGSGIMLIPVLLGGLLLARKLRRFSMVLTFIVVALASIVFLATGNSLDIVRRALVDTPLFFFAFVMFTEPLTSPPTRGTQMAYAAIVGALFSPQVHIGAISGTPELALVFGNIFSFIVSPKGRYLLTLKEKKQIGKDEHEFTFTPDRPVKFRAGQFMEWTIDPRHADSRGNRRFFTLASSPTEPQVHIGVKITPNGSSFKKKLMDMQAGESIIASQVAGEFTLPESSAHKFAFIAGGIGITPFRSIVRHMLDTNHQSSAVLFYSNKTTAEIAYKDIFDQAREKLGMKTVYTLTDASQVPADWRGRTGFIDAAMIEAEVPDYRDRTFYISGPHAMVTAFTHTLTRMGVPRTRIKTDFFPGFV